MILVVNLARSYVKGISKETIRVVNKNKNIFQKLL